MKVRGDAKPPQWAADYCPGKPGRAWVRFCLNAQEVTDGDWHGWEYDEYTTEVENTPGLQDEVAANLDALLLEAKANEKSKTQLVAENEALAAKCAKLETVAAALADQQSFYEDCIAEMAEVVYA